MDARAAGPGRGWVGVHENPFRRTGLLALPGAVWFCLRFLWKSRVSKTTADKWIVTAKNGFAVTADGLEDRTPR